MSENRQTLKTIGIVGLGLIGGSMALALQKHAQGRYTILGIDTNPEVMAAALSSGAVAGQLTPDRYGEVDLLVLALAPDRLLAFLQEQIPQIPPGTIVTDVCGVKEVICRQCVPLCREHGVWFLGGHPMAGKEASGFFAADPDLFVGASYILTPDDQIPSQVMSLVEEMALGLGCANITITTPANHDRMIAFTSQLPHVLAGAYVRSPRSRGHRGYSAGSYRDVSRVATLDEKLWSQLFLLNAQPLCEEIDLLIHHLQQCRDAIAAADRDRLEAILKEGGLMKKLADEESIRDTTKAAE